MWLNVYQNDLMVGNSSNKVLYNCYIYIAEKYFDMNKKMCRDALDIYKKFLIRMDRVAEALKVAEVIVLCIVLDQTLEINYIFR